MPQWAVAETMRDRAAAEELAEAGVPAYRPLVTYRGGRRGDWVTRSLFPRYIFAIIERASPASWRRVIDLHHVIRLICNDGFPCVVPDDVIAEIRNREGPDGLIKIDPPRRIRYRRGQPVRIKNGPASGIEGIFDIGWRGEGDRVRVLVNFLGKRTPVVLHGDDLIAA